MGDLVKHFMVVRGPAGHASRGGAPARRPCDRGTILSCFPSPADMDAGLRENLSLFCLPDHAIPDGLSRCWSFALSEGDGGRLFGVCLAFPVDGTDVDGIEGAEAKDGVGGEAEGVVVGGGGPAREARSAGAAGQRPATYVSLCILSRWSFLEAFKTYLEELFVLRYWESARDTLAASPSFASGGAQFGFSPRVLPRVEDFLCNLLHEVPVPPRGRKMVQLTVGLQEMCLKRPAENEIPVLVDPEALAGLFRLLDVPSVVRLLRCLVFEEKVVVHCRQPELLTPTIEAIVALLFPFKWHGVFIPYLPGGLTDLSDLVDMPTMCIVGVHTSYVEAMLREDGAACIEQVVLVDLNPQPMQCRDSVSGKTTSMPQVRMGKECSSKRIAWPKKTKEDLEKQISK